MSSDILILELKNEISEIERLSHAVEKCGQDHDLPSRVVFDMNLALEEIVTNVISYGFVDDGEHHIVVRLSLNQGVLTAAVEDDGRPFNPLGEPISGTDAPLEKGPTGGFGIHIVRKVMDEIEYRREDNRNILVMSKKTMDS